MSDQQFEQELESAPISPINTSNMSDNTNNSLIGIKKLFSESWKIYKNKFKVFFGILIIPTLITLFFVIFFASIFMTVFSANSFMSSAKTPSIILFVLGIIFAVFIIIIQMWSQVSMLYVIKDYKENINIKEAYNRSKSSIFPVLIVSSWIGLALFGGFMLLIIPGIIFYVWFAFSNFVLICENIKGKKALSRSKEYVKGKWFKVFIRLLVSIIVCAILYSIVAGIFSKIGVDKKIVENLTTLISGLFLSPFFGIYLFLLYEDLKRIKNNN